MPTITYLDAITQALREEMQRDPEVFLLGEDIGVFGGAFKVTKGLIDEFGPNRVLDMPLAESAIVGASCGAAVMGMRPVAEMQFADFITSGFNMLVNYAAKAYYRWGACVPIVIRCPSGGGVHGGPFHSECPEGLFTHVPGLKVVAPATAYDAKGLLKAAIRDNNPVLYFEHKYLYRRIKDEVPEEDYLVPLGVARLAREGRHASIITYGWMVHIALEAAQALAAEGIEIEVLDLRSLIPYDRNAILATVRKTNRVLLLHEAHRTGGFGGELAACIAEDAFEYLDAPIKRLAGLDTPVPYSPPLEEFYQPNAERVAQAARELVAF